MTTFIFRPRRADSCSSEIAQLVPPGPPPMMATVPSSLNGPMCLFTSANNPLLQFNKRVLEKCELETGAEQFEEDICVG